MHMLNYQLSRTLIRHRELKTLVKMPLLSDILYP